jgi:antitoxin (DNA-binding transcriptional repressor) of toxin-antitoxin stability system
VQISVTDAKAKLTELVRRAEADEEIILTRRVKISHGRTTLRATGRQALCKLFPSLSPACRRRKRLA